MQGVMTSDWQRAVQMSIAWACLGVVAFLSVLAAAEWGYGKWAVSDRGVVQICAAILLIFSSLYSAWLSWRCPAQRVNFLLLAFLLAMYAGRECDLHKASFLAEHMTRLRFYSLPGVPLWQKAWLASLIVATVVAAVIFLVRIAPLFLRSMKRREPWSILATLWFVTLAVSQLSDKSPLNYTLTGQAFEEVLEMVAAGFTVLVVAYFPRGQQSAAG